MRWPHAWHKYKIFVAQNIHVGTAFDVANVYLMDRATKSITVHYGSFPKKCIFADVEDMAEHIERLKKAVTAAFGQTLDAPTDYERLSANIQLKTGELISASTLKRLFGYIKPGTVPRPSTLSVLARYVGSTGWSDFCSKEASEEHPKPRATSRKAVYSRPAVYMTIAILCIGGIFGWLVGNRTTKNTAGTTTMEAVPETVPETKVSKKATVTANTNEQKYEQLLLAFISLTREKCDSVRACRKDMDIISYKELVDNIYFPFVFTFLKDSINRQAERTFPDDALRERYSNDIWIQCREICAELIREIPADELIEAYK